MRSLRFHVGLLCIVGYFITVESRNYVIKASNHRNPDSIHKKTQTSHAAIAKLLNKVISKGKLKQHDIGTLITKIVQKKAHKKLNGKRNLRNGIEVRSFLNKLNHFMHQNTRHSYYLDKHKDCYFGSGNPSNACKRQKFRRHAIRKSRKDERNTNNYAQPMLVERANYRSSSSSEYSDKPAERHKSRFQIVNNKHKKRIRQSTESEEQSREVNSNESNKKKHVWDSEEITSAEAKTKHAEKFESDEIIKVEPESSMEEHNAKDSEREMSIEEHNAKDAEQALSIEKQNAKESGTESSMEDSRESKYMYLQGTRLQRPNLRANRVLRSGRRGDRLPYFMPKVYRWDEGMLHHLDTYWENIKAYDTYHKKFQETWQ